MKTNPFCTVFAFHLFQKQKDPPPKEANLLDRESTKDNVFQALYITAAAPKHTPPRKKQTLNHTATSILGLRRCAERLYEARVLHHKDATRGGPKNLGKKNYKQRGGWKACETIIRSPRIFHTKLRTPNRNIQTKQIRSPPPQHFQNKK